MPIEEQQLIEKCLAGELENFGGLYDLYADKVYRFIFYRVRHKETAQDLASQTFFKALNGIKKFKTDRQFSSWLFLIAKNNVIDYWRANKQEKNIDDCWDLSSSENIGHDAEIQERIRLAKQYLKELNSREREIVIMRAWDGLSYQEIAEIMGKSEAACKMAFSRAVAKLREKEAVTAVFLLPFIINLFE